MVEHRLTVADRAAHAELVIELLDRASPQLRDRNVAKPWPDASLEVAPVAVERRFLALVAF
jgi:hypothetical protein